MPEMNLEILAYEQTQLGPLCLRRRELLSDPGTIVTEVTLNHEFLMSSLYTDSECALTNLAIEMHGGKQLRVLIGGFGLGYTAREALASDRVASVEVVELLPQVIDWLKQGLIPLSDALLEELKPESGDGKRLKISQGDVYATLAEEPQSQFDLILIDVDHSPDDRLENDSSIPFYTEAGLRIARQHLAEDGVLAVWSYAESSPFADALSSVFREVRVESVTHENRLIDEEHTDWLFFARGPGE